MSKSTQLRPYSENEYSQVKRHTGDSLGVTVRVKGDTVKNTIVLEKDGFKTTWSRSEDAGCVDILVEKDEQKVMDWTYPTVRGHKNLAAAASFWLDQAILQAKSEIRK
jgi:hypothetical protein